MTIFSNSPLLKIRAPDLWTMFSHFRKPRHLTYSDGRVPSGVAPSGEHYDPTLRLFRGLPMTADQIAVFENLEPGLELIIVADPLYMYEMGVGVTLIDRQDPQGEPTATHGFVTPWGTFLGVTRQ